MHTIWAVFVESLYQCKVCPTWGSIKFGGLPLGLNALIRPFVSIRIGVSPPCYSGNGSQLLAFHALSITDSSLGYMALVAWFTCKVPLTHNDLKLPRNGKRTLPVDSSTGNRIGSILLLSI